jgi:hypothetical protein
MRLPDSFLSGRNRQQRATTHFMPSLSALPPSLDRRLAFAEGATKISGIMTA